MNIYDKQVADDAPKGGQSILSQIIEFAKENGFDVKFLSYEETIRDALGKHLMYETKVKRSNQQQDL